MSKSENTTPYRYWAVNGLVYHDPIRCYRFGHKSYTKWAVQIANRRARRVAREELKRGVQPDPYRPRNGVKWERV